MSGWIGVDLDGTLAHYDEGSLRGIEHIGPPIPAMLKRVQHWLQTGQEVRIFTARATGIDQERACHAIRVWCALHIGRVLPITATKDFACIQIWDDRAVQVLPNTGVRVDGDY